MRVAIFIPAYEAETTIAEVVARIPESVREAVDEILIQDDASHDGTVKIATGIAETCPKVTVIENPVNLGYGGTLKKAHAYLSGRGFGGYVMVHGDLQYDPEDIGKLLEPITSGTADLVLGSRMRPDSGDSGMPFYKRTGNRFLTARMNRSLNLQLTDYHTGSVALNCESVERICFATMGDGHEISAQLLIRAATRGLRIAEVPVNSNYGARSRSCSLPTSVRYGLRVLLMLRDVDG